MDFERFKKTQSRVLKLIENSYKKLNNDLLNFSSKFKCLSELIFK